MPVADCKPEVHHDVPSCLSSVTGNWNKEETTHITQLHELFLFQSYVSCCDAGRVHSTVDTADNFLRPRCSIGGCCYVT